MNNRLIICSPELGISPESNSGGEVYDREMIDALCNLGHKLIVLLPKNKKYKTNKNLIVHYLPFSFVWPPYLFNILIIPWLFWLYYKYKFNILRIHSPYFVGFGALVFKSFYKKIPLITVYHHIENNFLYHLINKLVIRRWDKIIADSKYTKDEILKLFNIEHDKINIIYAGVDKRFMPKTKNRQLINLYNLHKSKVLLFLGGLKKRKNIYFLIYLMKKLNRESVKLLLCGSGCEYNRLKKLVNRLGIEDKVIFTGFVSEEDKVDYYNLADIFLFPSFKEGFGMPIIESAACSVPSIASNNSSLKELIVNSKTGYLVDINNLDGWMDKIITLLNNESLKIKMGESARTLSFNFSWKKSAQKIIDIIYSL